MKKVIFVLVLLGLSNSVWPGGELGNSRSLKALFMGFELQYPDTWTELSMEYLIALSPAQTRGDDKDIASYSIILLEWPEVQTVDELGNYLSHHFPEVKWVASELKGVPGFKTAFNSIGVLENSKIQEFYLKETGKVLRVSYDLTPDHISHVIGIHNSFQWLK